MENFLAQPIASFRDVVMKLNFCKLGAVSGGGGAVIFPILRHLSSPPNGAADLSPPQNVVGFVHKAFCGQIRRRLVANTNCDVWTDPTRFVAGAAPKRRSS